MSIIRRSKSPLKELATIGIRQMKRRKLRTLLTLLSLLMVAASFSLTISISATNIFIMTTHRKLAEKAAFEEEWDIKSVINRYDETRIESFGIEIYPSSYVKGSKVDEVLKIISENSTISPALRLNFANFEIDENNPDRNVIFQTYLEARGQGSMYQDLYFTNENDTEYSLYGITGIEPNLCAKFKGWDTFFTQRSDLCDVKQWKDFTSDKNSILVDKDNNINWQLEVNDTIDIYVSVKDKEITEKLKSLTLRVAGFYDKDDLRQENGKVTTLTGNPIGRVSGGSDIIMHLTKIEQDLIKGGTAGRIAPKEWIYGNIEIHLNKTVLLAQTGLDDDPDEMHKLLDEISRKIAKEAKGKFYGSTTVRYVLMSGGSSGHIEITQLRIQPFYEANGWEPIIIMLTLISFLTFNLILGFVYETKREIFVFTTSGAPPRDIANIFRLQAVVLGLTGGIAGSITGIGVALLANTFAEQINSLGIPLTIPHNAMALNPFGFFITSIVFIALNLLAAEYPSRMASRLSVPSLKRTWLPSGQELQKMLDKDKHTIEVPIHIPLELVPQLVTSLKGYIQSKVGGDISTGMMGTGIEERETKFGHLWTIRTTRMIEGIWGIERVLIIVSILKRPQVNYAIVKITGSVGAASTQTAATIKTIYEVIDEFRSYILNWHVERLKKVEIIRKETYKTSEEEKRL